MQFFGGVKCGAWRATIEQSVKVRFTVIIMVFCSAWCLLCILIYPLFYCPLGKCHVKCNVTSDDDCTSSRFCAEGDKCDNEVFYHNASLFWTYKSCIRDERCDQKLKDIHCNSACTKCRYCCGGDLCNFNSTLIHLKRRKIAVVYYFL